MSHNPIENRRLISVIFDPFVRHGKKLRNALKYRFSMGSVLIFFESNRSHLRSIGSVLVDISYQELGTKLKNFDSTHQRYRDLFSIKKPDR